MSFFHELIGARTNLTPAATDHLERLVGEWQVLADLAFSDLLLMAPAVDGGGFVVLAQMRPYTAQTLHQDDQVGHLLPVSEVPAVGKALAEGRIVREGDPVWRSGTPVRIEAIPVRFQGSVVAVVSQEANLSTARTPSRLELTYLQFAGDLATMITEGTFPYPASEPDPESSPRVGDGLLRLEATGHVTYASPNAVSAYRRLGVTGNVQERPLAEFDPEPAEVVLALSTRRPGESEVERRGAVVLRRVIPIVVGAKVTGALVLIRDVTDLRRRDRMLLLKDATIREIHHRVKNNLQTVASLLRIQGRRLHSDEAKSALAESERRIRSIAIVHETLSHDEGDAVDFDRVAERVVRLVEEGLAGPGVTIALEGSWGEIPAEVATPLSVALVELLQNSVDHAFDGEGRVAVRLSRENGEATVEVADDGRGLPAGFSIEDHTGLGLSIVRTLVEGDLGGHISMHDEGGTRVRLSVPLAEGPALPLP
jgi:two-component sensor histidine kinase